MTLEADDVSRQILLHEAHLLPCRMAKKRTGSCAWEIVPKHQQNLLHPPERLEEWQKLALEGQNEFYKMFIAHSSGEQVQ